MIYTTDVHVRLRITNIVYRNVYIIVVLVRKNNISVRTDTHMGKFRYTEGGEKRREEKRKGEERRGKKSRLWVNSRQFFRHSLSQLVHK